MDEFSSIVLSGGQEEQFGRIDVLLPGNRLILSGAAGGDVSAAEGDVVKTLVCDNAIRAMELALALCGNHGLPADQPLERRHRDPLCRHMHTPQPDAAPALAARVSLGSS